MGWYHLAQLDIANAVASMESQEMAGFVARLDEIHELSDNADEPTETVFTVARPFPMSAN